MKKTKLNLSFVITFLFIISNSVHSQTIYEDFEGAAMQTWMAIDGEYFGQEPNPFQEGANTSSGIGAYKKGVPAYSLFLTTLGSAMDLSTDNQFTIQIYSPVPSAIIMKLESDTGPDIEELKPITAVEQWVQYDFDFSAAAAYQDLTKIVLFFNPGVENMEDTYLFDYITAFSVTLPVEFVDVEATYHKGTKQALIQWSTAQEVNNERFDIQYSFDGSPWKTIGSVKGIGRTHKETNYSFSTPIAQSGSHAFRIKQFDYDRNYQISHPVNFKVESTEYSVYPNPAADYIVVESHEDSEVLLVDNNGQTINTWKVNTGSNQLDLSGLQAGHYVIQNKSKTFTESIILK